MKAFSATLALAVGALPLAYLADSAVQAQSIMRSPNLNVGARIPSINPSVNPTINPTINPNIAGRSISGLNAGGLRIRPACSAADRGSGGECSDLPAPSANGGGGSTAGKNKVGASPRNPPQAATNLRAIADQIVAEIDGALSDAQTDELARRHGLVRIGSQNFPLIGGNIGLFRIANRRTVEAVSRELAGDPSVRSVQPNFRYVLQQHKTASIEGDPAQYAVAKLRLPEAHKLAHGDNVLVAVIDSGIDLKQPELANSIAGTFDALGGKEGPHVHGTGVAGAIVAHARLMGSAPAAKLLAIRAFGVASSGAESTSFVVLKGLDYAAAHGAQIINMSFAGPRDPLIERGIAAAAAKGIVLVAAAGNAGPKSPPLYPAANPSVIAVGATDVQDRLFVASNRGSYVALAAPGVDIFLPAPDEKYQVTSGTSFSAAYVSGLAALMLERNSSLKPAELRAILTQTARDLGPTGRDDLFGAGEADAFAAVSAVPAPPGIPLAASNIPVVEKGLDRKGLDQPGLNQKDLNHKDLDRNDLDPKDLAQPDVDASPDNMASDKSAGREAGRPGVP